jgi:tetratricopeptide (TPR) repeat protein
MDMFYEEAVRILMDTKQYERAQKLLLTGLKYNRSGFIYKWLGQTSLILNQLKDGLNHLLTAYTLQPEDEQISQNLVRAYFNMFDFERGDEVLEKYQKVAQSAGEITKLQSYGLVMRKKASEVNRLVEIAAKHFEDENYRQAISALQKSVQIHETAGANELMGVIMLRGHKASHAATYFERARQMELTERPSLIYNLALSYLESGQIPKAVQTTALLKKSFPDFGETQKLEGMIGRAVAGQANRG